MVKQIETETEAYNFDELIVTVTNEQEVSPTLKVNKMENQVLTLDPSTVETALHTNQYGESVRINATLLGTNNKDYGNLVGEKVSIFLAGGRMKQWNEMYDAGLTFLTAIHLVSLTSVKTKTGNDYIPFAVKTVAAQDGGQE